LRLREEGDGELLNDELRMMNFGSKWHLFDHPSI